MDYGTSYEIGRYYEKLLAKRLEKLGVLVFLVPASGKGRARAFPADVIAFTRRRVIFFEVKYRSKQLEIEIDIRTYEKWKMIKDYYGFEFYLCVWYGTVKDFRCVDIDHYSNKTSYCVYYAPSLITREGLKVEEIIEKTA